MLLKKIICYAKLLLNGISFHFRTIKKNLIKLYTVLFFHNKKIVQMTITLYEISIRMFWASDRNSAKTVSISFTIYSVVHLWIYYIYKSTEICFHGKSFNNFIHKFVYKNQKKHVKKNISPSFLIIMWKDLKIFKFIETLIRF